MKIRPCKFFFSLLVVRVSHGTRCGQAKKKQIPRNKREVQCLFRESVFFLFVLFCFMLCCESWSVIVITSVHDSNHIRFPGGGHLPKTGLVQRVWRVCRDLPTWVGRQHHRQRSLSQKCSTILNSRLWKRKVLSRSRNSNVYESAEAPLYPWGSPQPWKQIECR